MKEGGSTREIKPALLTHLTAKKTPSHHNHIAYYQRGNPLPHFYFPEFLSPLVSTTCWQVSFNSLASLWLPPPSFLPHMEPRTKYSVRNVGRTEVHREQDKHLPSRVDAQIACGSRDG